MADSKHQIPLHELAVDYVTDKIPPGWYVGCKLSLKKYMELAEDWKKMKGLNDDLAAQVAACRLLGIRTGHSSVCLCFVVVVGSH